MANKLKKIYSILILLKNFLFRKKHYVLTFVAEYGSTIKRWYYDFKHWGFNHDNLEMVSGADALCEQYAEGGDSVTVDVIASKKKLQGEAINGYDEYVGYNMGGNSIADKLLYGRTYNNIVTDKDNRLHVTTIWICPVTLFVLGRYPNYLYIKKKSKD